MPQRRFGLAAAVFAALFVLSGVAGCNLAPAKKAESTPAEKPAKKADPEELSLPSTWPAEIPIYPGSSLVKVDEKDGGLTLLFDVEQTADEIFYWYYDQLEAQQWQMKGPTLDVAQQIAIIRADLGEKHLDLDVRKNNEVEGDRPRSTMTLGASGLR